jgi:hypothetical protein
LAATTSPPSTIARSVPTPQSTWSTSPSRASILSLPNGIVQDCPKPPHCADVESPKSSSRPGPPVNVSWPKPPSTRSGPAPPLSVSALEPVRNESAPPRPSIVEPAPSPGA